MCVGRDLIDALPDLGLVGRGWEAQVRPDALRAVVVGIGGVQVYSDCERFRCQTSFVFPAVLAAS